jgi:hypothetical protein
MESNWSKKVYVIHFVKAEFHNFKYGLQDCRVLLSFSVSNILFVLGGQFQLVDQLLEWLNWKFVYT